VIVSFNFRREEASGELPFCCLPGAEWVDCSDEMLRAIRITQEDNIERDYFESSQSVREVDGSVELLLAWNGAGRIVRDSSGISC